MQPLIAILISLLLLQGCSYKGMHEGLKQTQRNSCDKLMEPDRSSCLESLDFSYEEYSRQRAIKTTPE